MNQLKRAKQCQTQVGLALLRDPFATHGSKRHGSPDKKGLLVGPPLLTYGIPWALGEYQNANAIRWGSFPKLLVHLSPTALVLVLVQPTAGGPRSLHELLPGYKWRKEAEGFRIWSSFDLNVAAACREKRDLKSTRRKRRTQFHIEGTYLWSGCAPTGLLP